MRQRIFVLAVLILCLFTPGPEFGQFTKGVINRTVTDFQGSVLHGAKVDFQPQFRIVTTDELNDFTMTAVNPGAYAVTITYVSFTPYSGTVTVAVGQTAQIVGILKVAKASEEVIIAADRSRGGDVHESSPQGSRRNRQSAS